MNGVPDIRYDVASVLNRGHRDYQEDAIVTDFPFGMDSGVAVLADGMGGHEAGDVASKIVVTEVYSELKFRSASFAESEKHIPDFFASATFQVCASQALVFFSRDKKRCKKWLISHHSVTIHESIFLRFCSVY